MQICRMRIYWKREVKYLIDSGKNIIRDLLFKLVSRYGFLSQLEKQLFLFHLL